MQIGAQRIISEVLFPEARRQFGDTRGRMLPHALKHIDEIGVRIDAVQAAGHDQTLDNADMSGPELGPTKEP